MLLDGNPIATQSLTALQEVMNWLFPSLFLILVNVITMHPGSQSYPFYLRNLNQILLFLSFTNAMISMWASTNYILRVLAYLPATTLHPY